MAIVYIGIGSNIGRRKENCMKAFALLKTNAVEISKRSSLYESEPWGIIDQPKFVNLVVEGDTQLSPEQLLKTVKSIERDLGRKKSVRWGPRVIDLDILLYNNMTINTPILTIPHQHLHDREFVLKPLSELSGSSHQ
jgi:2-amino-4-hydroxy-6-hydroxymethyldihydropteridine diphosphokinase